jgi:hypothetical protein
MLSRRLCQERIGKLWREQLLQAALFQGRGLVSTPGLLDDEKTHFGARNQTKAFCTLLFWAPELFDELLGARTLD